MGLRTTFAAVVFDFRGTLATREVDWVAEALRRLGRDPGGRDDVAAAVEAANGPEDRLDGPGVDSDPALHRRTYLQVFADAGLDAELAEALYAVESDLSLDRFAADVAGTFTELRRRGTRIGVLSDIHVDVRPAFAAAGLAGLVDGFTLSFEVGVQKPDPRVFEAALDGLGVPAAEALMVGDRAAVDGGGLELGMTVLLVPALRSVEQRRLHRVVALCAG